MKVTKHRRVKLSVLKPGDGFFLGDTFYILLYHNYNCLNWIKDTESPKGGWMDDACESAVLNAQTHKVGSLPDILLVLHHNKWSVRLH